MVPDGTTPPHSPGMPSPGRDTLLGWHDSGTVWHDSTGGLWRWSCRSCSLLTLWGLAGRVPPVPCGFLRSVRAPPLKTDKRPECARMVFRKSQLIANEHRQFDS